MVFLQYEYAHDSKLNILFHKSITTGVKEINKKLPSNVSIVRNLVHMLCIDKAVPYNGHRYFA